MVQFGEGAGVTICNFLGLKSLTNSNFQTEDHHLMNRIVPISAPKIHIELKEKST